MRTVLLLALAVAVLGCDDRPPPAPQGQVKPGITPENFARLRKGMTPDEVKAILGPPSSSMYLEGNAAWQDPHPGETKHLVGKKRVHWQWSTQIRHLEGYDVVVDFEDGKASSLTQQTSVIDPR
jgi:hypothetical protein